MRYYVISETRGLVYVTDHERDAEYAAVVAAVGTGRAVYPHDRLTEA